jgi:hypothetical protein
MAGDLAAGEMALYRQIPAANIGGVMGKSRLLLLVLGLAACGSPSSDSGVRTTDSAGVTLVTSPGTDRPYPFTVTLQRRLILNASLSRIEVYDTAGQRIALMGREGGGPGEFGFPAGLQVSADGQVSVVDYGKGALVRFGPDRMPISELPYQQFGFPYSGIQAQGDTVYLDTNLPRENSAVWTLRRFSPRDSITVAQLVLPASGELNFGCVILRGQAPVLSPLLVWAVGDSALAVADEPGYRVDLRVNDRLVRSIRRSVTPVPAGAAGVRRLYPEGQRIGFGRGRSDGCTISVEDLIEQQGVAPVVPEIQGLVLAPDGTLWVQRYTFPDEPQRVDVFDPSGVYRGTITGHGVPAGFLSGNRVLFPIKDEETGGYSLGLFVLEPDGEPS